MKTKHFVAALEHPKITAAITDAERLSSGQIRVFVTHHAVDDVLGSARERFATLGMEKTAARNAVLVFLAPESRKFAVVGDQGIHERCGGDDYWQKVVGETMRPRLRESRYTEAIVAAIGEVGKVLAQHFPPDPGGAHTNELPDEIEED